MEIYSEKTPSKSDNLRYQIIPFWVQSGSHDLATGACVSSFRNPGIGGMEFSPSSGGVSPSRVSSGWAILPWTARPLSQPASGVANSNNAGKDPVPDEQHEWPQIVSLSPSVVGCPKSLRISEVWESCVTTDCSLIGKYLTFFIKFLLILSLDNIVVNRRESNGSTSGRSSHAEQSTLTEEVTMCSSLIPKAKGVNL